MPSRFLKGLFVLGIVLCSCLYGTAQAYTPMLLDSTIRSHIEAGVEKFPAVHRIYFSHIIEGDTVLDGVDYKLVYEYHGCSWFDWNSRTLKVKECRLVGAIREEGKVVYFYRFKLEKPYFYISRGLQRLEEESEHILFDFNIQTGDTLKLSSRIWITKVGEQIKDSITHHILESSEFRHIQIKWIEGHGGDHGLFGSYIDPWSQDVRGNFVDGLYYRGKVVNGYFPRNTCDLINVSACGTVTNTDNHPLVEFSVWPNPVLDEINIQSKQTINSIQVLDILGRTRAVETGPDQSIRLNSDLEAGQYILLVEFENGLSASERIVKYD